MNRLTGHISHKMLTAMPRAPEQDRFDTRAATPTIAPCVETAGRNAR